MAGHPRTGATSEWRCGMARASLRVALARPSCRHWTGRPRGLELPRVVGSIQRIRFRLYSICSAPLAPNRLLEVGYGSGVFLPELSSHCDCAFGIDVHSHGAGVRDVLAQESVVCGSRRARRRPCHLRDHTFDGVVAVSALEFADEPEQACHELARVLTDHRRVHCRHAGSFEVGRRRPPGADRCIGSDRLGDRRERTLPPCEACSGSRPRDTFPRRSRPALYRGYRLSPKSRNRIRLLASRPYHVTSPGSCRSTSYLDSRNDSVSGERSRMIAIDRSSISNTAVAPRRGQCGSHRQPGRR